MADDKWLAVIMGAVIAYIREEQQSAEYEPAPNQPADKDKHKGER
jgi:hypothetical protein